MKKYPQLIAVLFVCLTLASFAQTPDITKPRIWTAQSGTTLKAILVEVDDHQVVLRDRQGNLFNIPRHKISLDDQALLDAEYGPPAPPRDTVPPPAASVQGPTTTSQPFHIAGTRLNLGQKTDLRLPLGEATQAALRKEKLSADEAVVGLWLPENFDPKKEWNILLVSATQNSSSVNHMYHYFDGAREVGNWIVIAADGPNVPPPNDSTTWRWELAQAALLALDEVWPGVKEWPIATGGFSGGAKRSGLLGAILAKEKWNLIGMYMGGCNQDFATLGLNNYRPTASVFRKVPIYLSVGNRDEIAPVAKTENVKRAMESTGFRNVRIEVYDGAHVPHPPHVTDALKWFNSQNEDTQDRGGKSLPSRATWPR
ncbi:MAG: hypothetical protein GX803_09105 [Lentisphaerae bacterium]|jgi:hypothetical protein|nr:hypothetical protein [Lentisphaerota bacterium]